MPSSLLLLSSFCVLWLWKLTLDFLSPLPFHQHLLLLKVPSILKILIALLHLMLNYFFSLSSSANGLLQECLSKAMSDYDLIDEFFYSLSDEDVSEK